MEFPIHCEAYRLYIQLGYESVLMKCNSMGYVCTPTHFNQRDLSRSSQDNAPHVSVARQQVHSSLVLIPSPERIAPGRFLVQAALASISFVVYERGSYGQ